LSEIEQKLTPWGFWVIYESIVLAGVVRERFDEEGVSFVTPNEFSLQVAVMKRSKGHKIPSHFHPPVQRAIEGTQEVLIINRGKLRADLFNRSNEYVVSVELFSGDMLILYSGGHGFLASEDCKFFEVKQGPFIEGADKEIFENHVGTGIPIRLMS
jgi:hypothetical protein